MYTFISISRYGNFLGFPKLEPVRIPRGSPFPLRRSSLSPKASRGFRKRPEGSQKLPMSSPVPAPVAPEAPQRLPRRTQEIARAAQRPPRGSQCFPKASQRLPKTPEPSQNPLLSRQRLPEDARRCSRCSRKEPRHSQKAPRCLLGWRPCLWKIWPGAREEKIHVFFVFSKSRPRQSAFKKHHACAVRQRQISPISASRFQRYTWHSSKGAL